MNRARGSLSAVSLLALACLLGARPQALVDSSAYATNAARLARMTPGELAELSRRQKLFEAMSPTEQERLRTIDQRLFAEADAERLVAIWAEYNRWLGQVDSETRNGLMQLNQLDARIAAITREVTRRRQRNFGLETEDRLPEGDWPSFNSWLRKTGTEKLRELRSQNSNLPSTFDPNDRRLLRTPVLQSLNDDDLAELAKKLSEPGAAILARQKNRDEKIRLVIAWWISYFLQVPPDELQRFLKELPTATRLYIEQLGPEQGQQELKRRYLDDLRRRNP